MRKTEVASAWVLLAMFVILVSLGMQSRSLEKENAQLQATYERKLQQLDVASQIIEAQRALVNNNAERADELVANINVRFGMLTTNEREAVEDIRVRNLERLTRKAYWEYEDRNVAGACRSLHTAMDYASKWGIKPFSAAQALADRLLKFDSMDVRRCPTESEIAMD